jgi:hypothetical protein
MISRHVPLPQGYVRWLFPSLTDAAEYDRIRDTVQIADGHDPRGRGGIGSDLVGGPVYAGERHTQHSPGTTLAGKHHDPAQM